MQQASPKTSLQGFQETEREMKIIIGLTSQQRDQIADSIGAITARLSAEEAIRNYVQTLVDRQLADIYLERKPEEALDMFKCAGCGLQKRFAVSGVTPFCVCGKPMYNVEPEERFSCIYRRGCEMPGMRRKEERCCALRDVHPTKAEDREARLARICGTKFADGTTCGKPYGQHAHIEENCPTKASSGPMFHADRTFAERVYPSDKSNEFNIVDLANQILGSQIRGRQ